MRRLEPRQNDNFNPPSFFFLYFLPLSTTSGLCLPPFPIFSSLLLPFTPPTPSSLTPLPLPLSLCAAITPSLRQLQCRDLCRGPRQAVR